MNLVKSLHPDPEKALTKVTVTITGYFYDEKREEGFIATNWNIEGENQKISIGEVATLIDAGRDYIINANLKVDEN